MSSSLEWPPKPKYVPHFKNPMPIADDPELEAEVEI